MATAIEVKNLSKIYGSQAVLDDLNFQIEEGTMAAIIGPNGAGKSTLLRLMMGFISPTQGQVRLFGRTPRQARQLIGYVPQRFQFDRTVPMTVEEFMVRSAEMNGVPRSKRKTVIHRQMKKVGMDKLVARQLGQLSGGELQRLLIARALLTEKKVLFFDEPTAGVDIEGQETIYEHIRQIHEETGITCVLISHELDVVFRYAEQVLCLNRKLLCHGAPSEALTKALLEEMYGGGHAAHYHHSCTH